MFRCEHVHIHSRCNVKQSKVSQRELSQITASSISSSNAFSNAREAVLHREQPYRGASGSQSRRVEHQLSPRAALSISFEALPSKTGVPKALGTLVELFQCIQNALGAVPRAPRKVFVFFSLMLFS